ncbi:MAG: hypothetical protein R3C20_04245 [Planctomycetaceae bacterium]
MSLLRRLLLSLAAAMVLSDVALAQKGGGKTTPKLSITISPSTIYEGNTAAGVVTHNNSNTTSAVKVTLSTSDKTEAVVPMTVTIPAGTTSATFLVNTLSDGIVDGNQPARISASAKGYSSTIADIIVSDKPIFEYRTTVVPTSSTVRNINGITNNRRVFGAIWNSDGSDQCGFMYDQVTGNVYEMNRISALAAQVHQLTDADFSIYSITSMNESGVMTGYIENSTSGIRYGIIIDPIVEGQFNDDPIDWIVELLPDLGSTYTQPTQINEFGDVVGVFRQPDGFWGAYICNPWSGGTPSVLPVTLSGGSLVVKLNDFAEVAGVDSLRRAFRYDSSTEPVQFYSDADYASVTGLNNAGVFSGRAWITVPGTSGNGTTTTPVAYRHDGILRPIADTIAAALADSLKETGDVACYSQSSSNPMLSHTGFGLDDAPHLFSLSESIAADDPLKTLFVTNGAALYAINDRDDTGYPQLVCRMAVPDGSGGTASVAVILTPELVP